MRVQKKARREKYTVRLNEIREGALACHENCILDFLSVNWPDRDETDRGRFPILEFDFTHPMSENEAYNDSMILGNGGLH